MLVAFLALLAARSFRLLDLLGRCLLDLRLLGGRLGHLLVVVVFGGRADLLSSAALACLALGNGVDGPTLTPGLRGEREKGEGLDSG